MSDPVRVLLADDHPPTRAGIRRSLESDGFAVCAEAADAEEAVKAAIAERPDMCLLDVRMPAGGTGSTRSRCGHSGLRAFGDIIPPFDNNAASLARGKG